MIGVAVVGLGVVGSGVVRMLTDNSERVCAAAGTEVKPLYGVDIRQVELPEETKWVTSLEEPLKDERVKIVVEAIGGARIAYSYTKQALEAGRWVITSNKELVATHGDELTKLAKEHNAEYLFEASVGGGVPILRPLNGCLSGNNILAISGIVNGSTNYLLTRMEQDGIAYPEALEEAKKLGYVEANPAADVEGWDARRKLAILANASFGAKFADESILPTVGISGVTKEDVEACHAFNGTVKLIAHIERRGAGYTGWVHPAFVPQESPLFMVRDVFNGILVTGDCVGDVMFYGRGAGSMPTASAVVGDVIDAARHMEKGLIRNSFAETPAFIEDTKPYTAVFTVSLEDREQALAQYPDAHVTQIGDRLAVMAENVTSAKMAEIASASMPLPVL